MPVEVPADPEEGFPCEVPLVFYYGALTPSDNPDLYRAQLRSLAKVLDSREAVSQQAAAAGRVINTLGWVDGLGYELLKAAIAEMKADVVVVMEQDRLYNQLSNELRGSRDVQVRWPFPWRAAAARRLCGLRAARAYSA
jgi:polyribonucleotide 5'-hydroxyl-kinase